MAVGAVFRRRKILLIKRNFEPFTGLWGMPGGKILFGEHIEQAVQREVFEECGIKSKYLRFCGVLSEKVSLGAKSRMHYLVFVSELRATGGRTAASREGEVRWFPVADLRQLKRVMIPSDYLMLKQLVLDRRSKPGQVYRHCEIAKSRGEYRVKRFY